MADLDLEPCSLGEVEDFVGFFDGEREGLFAENIFAGAGADSHRGAVKFCGGHDDDGLDVLALSQGFDVVVVVIDLEFVGDLFSTIRVGVGDRD